MASPGGRRRAMAVKRRGRALGLAAVAAGAGLAMTTVGTHAVAAAGTRAAASADPTTVVTRGVLNPDGTVTRSQAEVPVTVSGGAAAGVTKVGTPAPQTSRGGKLDPRLAVAAK